MNKCKMHDYNNYNDYKCIISSSVSLSLDCSTLVLTYEQGKRKSKYNTNGESYNIGHP